MKKLLIGLLSFASLSVFAQQQFTNVCDRTIGRALTYALGEQSCSKISTQKMQELRALNLAKFSIGSLNIDDFKGLDSLEELSLYDNKIDHIPTGSFRGLAKLKKLNLCYNNLEKVSMSMFAHLPSLEDLNLCANKINKISRWAFEDSPKLKSVNLRGNPIELETLSKTELGLSTDSKIYGPQTID